MGYSSDMTVVFYSRSPENLPFAALKLWVDENYPLSEARQEWDAEITEDPDKAFILIQYRGVKWYPTYNHPQAVQATLERFSQTFENEDDRSIPMASWESALIGEELNDITHDGSPYSDYRLFVERIAYFD